MFELERVLREWRKTARRCTLSAGELDELEDHLCTAYVAHRQRGTPPAEAFTIALRTLGTLKRVSSEYGKVRSFTWLRLLKAGWAAFAAAYFLPVADGGITLLDFDLGEGLLPGVQAILVALEEGGWCTFSVLTNLLMLATIWRPRAFDCIRAVLLAVGLSASWALNAWWMTELDAVRELYVGYYAWWISFGLVSAGLLLRARALAGSGRSWVAAR